MTGQDRPDLLCLSPQPPLWQCLGNGDMGNVSSAESCPEGHNGIGIPPSQAQA